MNIDLAKTGLEPIDDREDSSGSSSNDEERRKVTPKEDSRDTHKDNSNMLSSPDLNERKTSSISESDALRTDDDLSIGLTSPSSESISVATQDALASKYNYTFLSFN